MKFTEKQQDIINALESDYVVRTFTFSYRMTGEKVFEAATLVSRKLYDAGEHLPCGTRAIDSVSVYQLAKKGILESGYAAFKNESGALLCTHFFTLNVKALRAARKGRK